MNYGVLGIEEGEGVKILLDGQKTQKLVACQQLMENT